MSKTIIDKGFCTCLNCNQVYVEIYILNMEAKKELLKQ
jgi:hypothetical protein